jgi:hypothetical protein
MKLIAQTLTNTEAALLCQRISLIEQTRPLVKEILQSSDPAQKTGAIDG